MNDNQTEVAVPGRQGKAWSIEEDRDLYDAFLSGQSAPEIALKHERTAGGIRSRLTRLGLLDQDGRRVEPIPPFVRPEPPQARAPRASATSEGKAEPVFAIRTDDGWVVEIKSNRPLSRAMLIA
jgi:hypothetical protein